MAVIPHLWNDSRHPTGVLDRLGANLGRLGVDLGRRTSPRGEKMAAACPGVDSRDLATILDPFREIFVDLGPDRLSAT